MSRRKNAAAALVTLVTLLIVLIPSCFAAEGAAPRLATVEGNINTNDVLKELEELDRGTKVTLNYGAHVGFLKSDGSFVIPDVPAGLYILEVTSINYTFDRLWIEVEGSDEPRASVYILGTDYEYNPMYSVPYPLELSARAKTSYFTPREGFNFFAILQNPMILMMGFMLIGVYVMPKLMEGIDPEELKKIQQEQSKAVQGSAVGKMLNAAQGR